MEGSLAEESPLARLACVMVGLPARGKTYTARKITRYLTWLGHRSRIFNVGNYRREAVGAEQKADFFDPENVEFSTQRAAVAENALNDMLDWLCKGSPHQVSSAGLNSPSLGTPLGSLTPSRQMSVAGAGVGGPSRIALYDATNSTKERRQFIYDRCCEANIKVFFVENICDDDNLVMHNIKEVKLSSPDYVGWETQDAINDFIKRIEHYAKSYESISADEFGGAISFVKIFNIGKQVTTNNVQGYLESRIVYFLMNLNTVPRSFYISRHGESMYNLEGKIGGNSTLSPQGLSFAGKLQSVIEANIHNHEKLIIWTSTLIRTIQTASFLNYSKLQWKQLDELSSGSCDGLTYEEIAQKYPEDFMERDLDKFNYRYRGGESYRDLVHRLEPVILELERHKDEDPIYIIGHQAVVRAIYAYFHGISHEELPYIKIPLHTIIKLTPKAYHCLEERIVVDVPAVDTFRPKQH
ncbi:Fructose-2,6-bisphosphatase [Boothiomyces sp. JEL0866]|nr:Fructose-2,6-bisphosphatase [Boothiomyces sp. JEL0866]